MLQRMRLNFKFHTFSYPPDADAGSGGETGASSDHSGDGGAAGGTSQVWKPSDDALVYDDDGTTPIKFSEWRSKRYVPRDQFDRILPTVSQIAADLDKREAALRTRSQQQQTQQRTDPYAELRNQQFVDGKTAAGLMEALEGKLGPSFKAIAEGYQRQQAEIAQLRTMNGPLVEQRQAQEFESYLDTAHKAVLQTPIKGMPEGATIEMSPLLREMQRDLYLSHQQDSWTRGEFEKAWKQRLEAVIEASRKAQQAAVQMSRDRLSKFYNPARGAGNPSGKQSDRQLTNQEFAARHFAAFRQPA